jgi:hypothetical protein
MTDGNRNNSNALNTQPSCVSDDNVFVKKSNKKGLLESRELLKRLTRHDNLMSGLDFK